MRVRLSRLVQCDAFRGCRLETRPLLGQPSKLFTVRRSESIDHSQLPPIWLVSHIWLAERCGAEAIEAPSCRNSPRL